MPATTRTILHVDMDAFYASIEQRDNPELRNKPVVVGGGSNRGVVAAASYEVRKFGVRSAMPIAEATRRCPQLIRVAPRMSHYKAASEEIFAVFHRFTPVVEGLSLDEAFLDVTASRALHGSGIAIAQRIKQAILDKTRLTASVGVAANKLVAKIASDLEKPDGLVVIDAKNCRSVLDPLPVAVIPGIGRQTLARLHKVNIYTLADLRRAPDRDLSPIFGRYAERARQRAAGIDERPVSSSRSEKSISSEETYDIDLRDRTEMERELLRLAESTAGRLRKSRLQAGTVQIKIRQSDFQTFTRQQSLQPPINNTDQIFRIARELLGKWLETHPGARIRLLGVGSSRLSPAEQ
ncbi:MAG: DNA polymerase IV, partial [Gammaproteobacteria bacterium]|nr:DNA polymerase IV [Gammaproteobacteria bacterium]